MQTNREAAEQTQARERNDKWDHALRTCNMPDLMNWALSDLIESCGSEQYSPNGELFYICLIEEQKRRNGE